MIKMGGLISKRKGLFSKKRQVRPALSLYQAMPLPMVVWATLSHTD